MKCKSHPYELGVGVCASCLRERLVALIAAQNELSANHHHHHHAHRRSDASAPLPLPQQPPSVFHRPVSPYLSHRRSVGSDASPAHPRLRHHYQRFFSTPQVGPTFDAASGGGRLHEINSGRRQRFSILKSLFGHHRSEEAEPGLGTSKVSASSGSWFSALIRGRKKKEKSQFYSAAEEEEGPPPPPPWRARRSYQTVDRGMSPSMEDDEEDNRTVYSSDEWRRPYSTPIRRFPANHRQHRSMGAVSGLSVCLSPLVSFGPEAPRSQPSDLGFSVDPRSPMNSIHYRNSPVGGAAVPPSRSRKLADFGRFK